MNNVARILIFNPDVESCADSIAATLRHSQRTRIEIWFVQSEQNPQGPTQGKQQQSFVESVHQKLSELSTDSEAYAATEHITIATGESVRPDNIERMIQGAHAIDVTGLPKEISLNLVAASLMGEGIPVFALRWLTKFEKNSRHKIGVQPYVYEDLVQLPKIRTLRRAFRARSHVLAAVGVVIFLVAIVAVFSVWYPALKPVSAILNSLGVAAGFAGLWIAVAEERRAI